MGEGSPVLFALHRLRRSTTDRAASTPDDMKADNEWRSILRDMIHSPGLYGISGPDGELFQGELLVYGADETPLQYAPPSPFFSVKKKGLPQRVRGT